MALSTKAVYDVKASGVFHFVLPLAQGSSRPLTPRRRGSSEAPAGGAAAAPGPVQKTQHA